MLAVLWGRRGCCFAGRSLTLRVHRLALYSLGGCVLDLLQSLHLLLLRCPLQGRVNQEPQVAEVLGGELLGRSWRRGVEKAAGGTCCRWCTGETGSLLLRLPQESLGIQPQQRLDRPLLTGEAHSRQNGRRRVSQEAQVQRGSRMDNGRPLLGRVAFWRAGPAPVRLVAVTFSPDLAGDGKLGGILAVLAEQVG